MFIVYADFYINHIALLVPVFPQKKTLNFSYFYYIIKLIMNPYFVEILHIASPHVNANKT